MLTLISFMFTHAGMITTGAFLVTALIAVIQKNWILCLAYLCMSLFMVLNYFPPTAYLSMRIINPIMWISFALFIFLTSLSVKKRQPSTLEIERWNKQKARGIRRFVLIYGVLLFGGLMFVFMSIGLFSMHETGVQMRHPITIHSMIFSTALCLIGGVFFGLCRSFVTEIR